MEYAPADPTLVAIVLLVLAVQLGQLGDQRHLQARPVAGNVYRFLTWATLLAAIYHFGKAFL